MPHHIIIGGGPAATNAAETIRLFDGDSEITLVSDEPAYSRMALPYWLAHRIPREHVLTGDDDYFRRLGVTTEFGHRAASIDGGNRSLTLDDGRELSFDNLLLATGSRPLQPPFPGTDLPGVQPMWTLAHTQQALDTVGSLEKPKAVLIGAGFIGFIVLNAMFKRGWDLVVVERESQVLPRMLDAGAAGFVDQWLDSRKVEVRTGTTVRGISQTDDGRKRVETDGDPIDADLVIVATGIEPNLELATAAGLDTDLGILVNDRMQTSVAGIYAGGDVAQGPVLYGDAPDVHAIQPTAVDHGRVAGANMARQEIHYPGSLLMNVVDVCGLQTASYGNWSDAGAEAMTIANESGLVYRKLLWRDDQIVGAVFTGQANDLGMLNDLGMVKGILQTQTALGSWKDYLREHPFDIRRAYVANRVAEKLASTTLLGRASRPRGFHFGGAKPEARANPAHAVFVDTKGN